VPRAVAMRSDHQRLLQAAGFHNILELDVTPAFAATAAAWPAETEPHAAALARLEPARRLQTATSRPAQHAGRHPRRAAAPRPPPRPNKRRAPTATARGMHDPAPTTLAATCSTIANQRRQHRRVFPTKAAVSQFLGTCAGSDSSWNRGATRRRPRRWTSSSPRSAAPANGRERQRDWRALPVTSLEINRCLVCPTGRLDSCLLAEGWTGRRPSGPSRPGRTGCSPS